MPLIDLKTNLKDLKFGYDRSNSDSSNEPFIQTRIPATNEPLRTGVLSISADGLSESLIGSLLVGAGLGAAGGAILGGGTGAIVGAVAGAALAAIDAGVDINAQLQLPTAGTGGSDFLLRGGLLLPDRIVKDTIRLAKYFKSTDGVLFTVKQNLLSRSGVRTQGAPFLLNEELYTPLSTILGAVGNPIGLHVNKQGLNPLLGISNEFVPNRYFSAIKDEITETNQSGGANIISNRLVGLFSVKMLGDSALSRAFSSNDISGDKETLLSYGGGPNSVLGTIGRTRIRYATNNIDAPLKTTDATTPTTLDYAKIKTLSDSTRESVKSYKPVAIDFRRSLKEKITKGPRYNVIQESALSADPQEAKILEYRTNLGDPGNFGKKPISYTNGYSNLDTSFGAASPNSYDKINALPIYRSSQQDSGFLVTSTNDPRIYRDLIDFRIGVIDNDTIQTDYIHFRAFLNTISDSYDANWNPMKYIGRGENFYTYAGFDRKVSLSWTVAAQSKVELIPMYKKLNYLASICAPDYSSFGYMRGNIVKLTIGGYFYEQPGIITKINYEMNDDDSSWEIAINDAGEIDDSVRQLPHIIKITSFEFIPIHGFVPRKQQNIYDKDTGAIENYGEERFIALKDRTENSLYVNNNTGFNSLDQDKTLSNFKGLNIDSPTPKEPEQVIPPEEQEQTLINIFKEEAQEERDQRSSRRQRRQKISTPRYI